MPHHLPPELIFAGSLWLTAIFIFVLMMIAALASLRSSGKSEDKPHPETKPKLSSVVARTGSKRKIKDRP